MDAQKDDKKQERDADTKVDGAGDGTAKDRATNDSNKDSQEANTKSFGSGNIDMPIGWAKMGETARECEPVIRYPTDVADISPDDLEVCLVGTAGQKITNMGKDLHKFLSPDITQLILRSHVIHRMEGLQGLSKMELLELYDNQVEALECLESPGPNLRVLDMSYNVIRDMKPVEICTNLQELCK
jgi:hypothetical protein